MCFKRVKRVERFCQIDALINHKKSPLDLQSRWAVPGVASAEKRGESGSPIRFGEQAGIS